MTTSSKCDTCEADARSLAVDMTDVTDDDSVWCRYELRGKVKRGCVDHPVTSDTYDKDGKMIERGDAVSVGAVGAAPPES